MCKPAPGEVKGKTYRSTSQGNELTKEGLDALVALQDCQSHLHGGCGAAIHRKAAAQAHSSLRAACEVVLHFNKSMQRSDSVVGFVVFVVFRHIISSGGEQASGIGLHGVGDSVAGLVQS
jgi:hypothetical protein